MYFQRNIICRMNGKGNVSSKEAYVKVIKIIVFLRRYFSQLASNWK